MTRLGLLGVPSSAGARQKGQEKAPLALRRAGLLERIHRRGLEVVDFGDLPVVEYRPGENRSNGKDLERVAGVATKVAQAVKRIENENCFPLIIGGDCTITLGVLDGMINRDSTLGMIYFDGDVDLHTPDTSVSGILDGMGVAHITGRGDKTLSQAGTRYPLMPEQDIVLFGYNQESGWIDEYESAALSDGGMAKFPLNSIRGKAKKSAKRAVRQLERRVDSVLVHFDVDVIDFRDFPAADVPHHHGLSFKETMEALAVFMNSRKVGGLVITEFNATRDTGGVLARRIVDGIGNTLSGNAGPAQWPIAVKGIESPQLA